MAITYTEHLQIPKHDPTDHFNIALINEGFDKTEAGILAAYRGSAAYNFLGNSNFEINQRGQSEYNSTGYSFDRWRFRSTNGGTVQKLAKGIRITTGTSGICGVYQRIATQDYTPVFDALAGEPVTLAIKISANTLSASGNSGLDLLDHNGTTTEGSGAVVIARKSIENGKTGIIVANGTMPTTMTNDGITALLRTPSTTVTGAIDIEWMALYKGTYTADTLPSYMPKGYAQELLECQRFYFRTIGQGYGYCTNTSAARLNIPIPVMMRAVPSVDNDSITITCHNNGNNITATGYSVAEMHGASIRLNLTSDAAFTRYTPLAGYASAEFGFSAEL